MLRIWTSLKIFMNMGMLEKFVKLIFGYCAERHPPSHFQFLHEVSLYAGIVLVYIYIYIFFKTILLLYVLCHSFIFISMASFSLYISH